MDKKTQIPTTTVLVVEDDAHTQLLVQTFLQKDPQFKLVFTSLGGQAIHYIEQYQPDIIILDIVLPDVSGLDLLNQFRTLTDAGIIMFSGSEAISDKVNSLHRGADVFLQKPVDLNYLRASIIRLRDRLKEREADHKSAVSSNNSEVPWVLNSTKWSLDYNQTSVMLTPSEFKLLDLLVDSGDKPASTAWLGQMLHRDEYESYDNVISTLISRLRKKVKTQTQVDLLIKAYRAEGYVLLSEVHRI